MNYLKIVQTMLQPEFYPHNPSQVEFIETHISYVFIAGNFVYKVKKPVSLGFLDFSTLEKRKHYCLEELRLNRRLASSIYIEVVSISEDNKGNLSLGWTEKNQIKEYAVKMKKLPHERLLINLIPRGKIDTSVINALSRKLVDFHSKAETGGEINIIGGLETVIENHEENFKQTKPYIDITIPRHKFHLIKSYSYGFLREKQTLFQKRLQEHKIKECHGDLRLEHICILNEAIMIFDCIEFNKRFRYIDVAADVAYLSMDFDYVGHPEYAKALAKSYIDYSKDEEINTLLNFYKCYYAFTQGKVVSFRSDDQETSEKNQSRILEKATTYFDLAYTYAARLETPTLIIMSGLTGTGKSSIVSKAASYLGAQVIRSDAIRKEFVNIPKSEHRFEEYKQGIYANEITEKIYQKALQIAANILKKGYSVIIDASFKKRKYRNQAYETALNLNTDFFVIECTCPSDIVRKRLDWRLQDSTEISNGHWEIYKKQKMEFEQLDELSKKHHIILDCSKNLDENVSQMIQQIKRIADL